MGTPPLGAQMVTDLAGETAWRFYGSLGPIATVRAFCCDSPNDGVNPDGKAPVAHIQLAPDPAFTGETVTYNGTLSYDPDGSVTGYSWTFEGHTPSSGTAISGTLNYATAGTYTIQLIVTDGTGLKSAPAREELIVQGATLGPGYGIDINGDTTPQTGVAVYAATDTGVYYNVSDGGTITWTAKNTGLSGLDLQVNQVVIDPATQNLPEGKKVLWAATDGGIFVSNDGGDNWVEKNPGTVSNQYVDPNPPTVDNLKFKALLFAGGRLYAGSSWLNADRYRAWVFYTADFGAIRADTSQTVTWSQLTTNWEV